MSNTYRTVLYGKNLAAIWDGKDFNTIVPSKAEEYVQYITEDDATGVFGWRERNWGCDGRIFDSDTKEDTIFLLTANASPMYIVSKLSSLLGDTILKHEYSDQSQCNDIIYHLKWQNGRMIEAKVSERNYETDEYSVQEISITDEYNVPI